MKRALFLAVSCAITCCAVNAAFAVLEGFVGDVHVHMVLTVDEARELLSAAGTGTPIPDRTAKRVASAVVKALSGRKPVVPPAPKPLPAGWRSRDIRVLYLDRQSEETLRSWMPPIRTLGDVSDQIDMGNNGLLMFDNHRADRVRKLFEDFVTLATSGGK